MRSVSEEVFSVERAYGARGDSVVVGSFQVHGHGKASNKRESIPVFVRVVQGFGNLLEEEVVLFGAIDV